MLILWIFFTTYLKVILDSISYVFLGLVVIIVVYVSVFKRKEWNNYLREKEEEFRQKYPT